MPMESCGGYVVIDAASNGPFKYCKSLNIAAITDGTSNTVIYSEKANGLFTPSESFCFNWWGDSVSGDTIFTTLYPVNAYKKVPNIADEYDYTWVESASSFHPGGANFAFATARSTSSRNRSNAGSSTLPPGGPSVSLITSPVLSLPPERGWAYTSHFQLALATRSSVLTSIDISDVKLD